MKKRPREVVLALEALKRYMAAERKLSQATHESRLAFNELRQATRRISSTDQPMYLSAAQKLIRQSDKKRREEDKRGKRSKDRSNHKRSEMNNARKKQ